MSKTEFDAGTLLAPLPAVLVSCQLPDGKPNIITVAWTGIISSHPPKTYVSIRPERYSHNIIETSGEFVINLTTAALTRTVDMCGTFTGKKVDKFERFSLTPEYIDGFTAPSIAQSPASFFCRVTQKLSFGSHDMFIADIVKTYIDSSLLDDAGKLHFERAGLIAYSHGEYFAMGKKLGKFGFAVKKK